MDEKLLKKGLDNFKPIHIKLVLLFQKYIDKEDSLLDVGCGIKLITRFLKCKSLIGIDIWKPYLEERDFYEDIRNLHHLPLNSYDVVLALDVIEHLNRIDGIKLISDMITICKKRIIIFTPIEWTKNDKNTNDKDCWGYGNPYNLHKSLWIKGDFLVRGFKILEHEFDKEYIIAIKEK